MQRAERECIAGLYSFIHILLLYSSDHQSKIRHVRDTRILHYRQMRLQNVKCSPPCSHSSNGPALVAGRIKNSGDQSELLATALCTLCEGNKKMRNAVFLVTSKLSGVRYIWNYGIDGKYAGPHVSHVLRDSITISSYLSWSLFQ
jgi:hypothetical protein